ncbi:glycosyltransferase WbsX family protein [Enterobacter sichuanensis]|uniref:glycosyltransferase WbsX family protein n=1 Tax=Enterobacter sichuanensis TaxID=2071710 RepID=UPI001AB00008|nr:glycoside hydrolase family 99-like domain-containing protein [Enterobacter sichuanensis]MBO2915117.1 glycoside hydrolase family 99-like domain-containing protein [Enterobacter sichuanensis]MBO2935217.1 glycoside hydrolase family 99-like domain-containing protein [Enterobacter sichuanensis]
MSNPQYKIFPFYFPQFYVTSENNKWWGDGFTDWQLVKNATPANPAQTQPRIPLLGHYDQSLPETIELQANLAKKYGINGFNFYHYWFDGKVLLDQPITNLLNNKSIDIEFFITWANETWTRQWIGKPNDILIKQEHRPDIHVWAAHYDYLKQFFIDTRYYKIDNSPVLCIYRAELINDLQKWIDFMNAKAREDGFNGLHLIALRAYEIVDAEKTYKNFAKIVNFQPRYSINTHLKKKSFFRNYVEKFLRSSPEWLQLKITSLAGNKKYKKFSYQEYIATMKKDADHWMNKPVYQVAFPDWDNAPRYKERATFFNDTSPENFDLALDVIKKKTEMHSDKIIFVNAWNEWSEGAYLEPDTINMYKNLEVLNRKFSNN